MAHKVVICGINTSALPKLTGKEALSLMRKVKEGDELARQKFITSNLRLVLSVVQRYAGKAGCSMDDLFQVGCVGLVKSVDNFDVSLNVKFSTYAVPMIIGEIRRFLRESNSMRVSRGIRDVAYLALQARERLERESMGEEVTNSQGNKSSRGTGRILSGRDKRTVVAQRACVQRRKRYNPCYGPNKGQKQHGRKMD